MYTQEGPNAPIQSHLDPERDTKAYPGKWDLSSLPQPVHPPVNGKDPGVKAEPPAEPPSSAQSQRYAEMQVDPFLDGDSPESCWGCQL